MQKLVYCHAKYECHCLNCLQHAVYKIKLKAREFLQRAFLKAAFAFNLAQNLSWLAPI